MIRSAAIVRSYYLTDYLPAVLSQFKDVDKILVVNDKFDSVDDNVYDNTAEIVKDYANAELLKTGLKFQHEIFNKALEKLKNYNAVFICDADEIYLKQDIRKLFNFIVDRKYDYVFVSVLDYVNDDMKNIYKIRNHKPVAIVNPKKVNFYQTRCLHSGEAYMAKEILIYHLGFCFNNDKMLWKSKNYWGTKKKKEIEDVTKSKIFSIQTPKEIVERVYACKQVMN